MLIVVGSRVAIEARVLQAVRDVLQDVAVWYASLRGPRVNLTSFKVWSRKRCDGVVCVARTMACSRANPLAHERSIMHRPLCPAHAPDSITLGCPALYSPSTTTSSRAASALPAGDSALAGWIRYTLESRATRLEPQIWTWSLW